MQPTAELPYDHNVLRAALAALEGCLPQLERRWDSTAHLTDTLESCLCAHAAQEEARLDARLGPRHPAGRELHNEHTNHRMRVAVLRALLTERTSQAKGEVVEQTCHLIKDLQEHLTKEAALCATLPQFGHGESQGASAEAPECLVR